MASSGPTDEDGSQSKVLPWRRLAVKVGLSIEDVKHRRTWSSTRHEHGRRVVLSISQATLLEVYEGRSPTMRHRREEKEWLGGTPDWYVPFKPMPEQDPKRVSNHDHTAVPAQGFLRAGRDPPLGATRDTVVAPPVHLINPLPQNHG